MDNRVQRYRRPAGYGGMIYAGGRLVRAAYNGWRVGQRRAYPQARRRTRRRTTKMPANNSRYGIRKGGTKRRWKKPTVAMRALKSKPYQRLVYHNSRSFDSNVNEQEVSLLNTGIENRRIHQMLPGVLNGEQKIFIRFHKVEFQIVNSTNNQIIIWLYCLESKKDSAVSSETIARLGDNPLGITHNNLEPTYSPISNRKINIDFKVKVKRKKILNPGEVFMYSHKRFVNHMFNTGRLVDGPAATAYGRYRGLTEEWLIRYQGTVAFKENSDGFNNGALISPAKIDTVVYETISYKVPDTTQRNTVTKVNDLTPLAPGEKIRVQNLDSGVVDDYSEG